jgi:hypothetical protein
MAASSADAAEMTQVPRNARVCPPLHNCHAFAADGREQSTENAKNENLTQRRKEAKMQGGVQKKSLSSLNDSTKVRKLAVRVYKLWGYSRLRLK